MPDRQTAFPSKPRTQVVRMGFSMGFTALLSALALGTAGLAVAAAPQTARATQVAQTYKGNTTNDSFNQAKKMLERQVYPDHRVTFYCRAPFDAKKQITLPEGFTTPKHEKRAHRIEWEHVVPAENFGRAFVEWREGASVCVDSKGKAFKGRRCAEKANEEFRLMQADMHNLFPAIGAVNAIRSNIRFGVLPGVPNTFGTCAMKVADGRVEPPEYARGTIARTAKYMALVYPKYRLSRQETQLFDAWDKQYPVDAWECERERRIAKLQGNANPVTREACRKAGL